MEPDTDAVALAKPIADAAHLYASVAADPKIHAALRRIADLTVASLRCDGTLFTCGNGGSAAQATHVAGELVGPFYDRERRPLRAIPLGFDPSSFTAIGNDRIGSRRSGRPLAPP